MTHTNGLNRFIEFYKDFKIEDRTRFNSVYDEGIVFVDPFHRVEGQDSLYQYFLEMMARVQDCRFEVDEVVKSDNSAFVAWRMFFTHTALNNKKPICVHGATHLRFSDKITFHRDYFDSSELLYKNIPILGSVVKLIERKM